MINFKNNLIKVRCLECKKEHLIEMKCIGTYKDQRSIGFEYEYTYSGELKCSYCCENMKLLTTIFEYPKGILNYYETNTESCLVMNEITEEILNIL